MGLGVEGYIYIRGYIGLHLNIPPSASCSQCCQVSCDVIGAYLLTEDLPNTEAGAAIWGFHSLHYPREKNILFYIKYREPYTPQNYQGSLTLIQILGQVSGLGVQRMFFLLVGRKLFGIDWFCVFLRADATQRTLDNL